MLMASYLTTPLSAKPELIVWGRVVMNTWEKFSAILFCILPHASNTGKCQLIIEQPTPSHFGMVQFFLGPKITCSVRTLVLLIYFILPLFACMCTHASVYKWNVEDSVCVPAMISGCQEQRQARIPLSPHPIPVDLCVCALVLLASLQALSLV